MNPETGRIKEFANKEEWTQGQLDGFTEELSELEAKHLADVPEKERVERLKNIRNKKVIIKKPIKTFNGNKVISAFNGAKSILIKLQLERRKIKLQEKQEGKIENDTGKSHRSIPDDKGILS